MTSTRASSRESARTEYRCTVVKRVWMPTNLVVQIHATKPGCQEGAMPWQCAWDARSHSTGPMLWCMVGWVCACMHWNAGCTWGSSSCRPRQVSGRGHPMVVRVREMAVGRGIYSSHPSCRGTHAVLHARPTVAGSAASAVASLAQCRVLGERGKRAQQVKFPEGTARAVARLGEARGSLAAPRGLHDHGRGLERAWCATRVA